MTNKKAKTLRTMLAIVLFYIAAVCVWRKWCHLPPSCFRF